MSALLDLYRELIANGRSEPEAVGELAARLGTSLGDARRQLARERE